MKYICFFYEPRAAELALVGSKGTYLARMARAGFPVPPGFYITAEAYRYLVAVTGLSPIITRMVAAIDFQDPAGVAEKASRIRELITQQPIPQYIADEIQSAYKQMDPIIHEAPSSKQSVAVRSSAVAMDLPDICFTGQQDTYLNIRGNTLLLQHVRRCWASLWTARAITYRHKQGINHQQVFPAIIVQPMIDPQSSGNVFTVNPTNGYRTECVINASWGLGETISSGTVPPDTYIVKKVDGRIRKQHIACKEQMITSSLEGGTVVSETAAHIRNIPTLNERQVAELTALVSRIEDHFGQPQDIEWAKDGGRWHILQSRPMTTLIAEGHPPAFSGKYNRSWFVEILPETPSQIATAQLRRKLHNGDTPTHTIHDIMKA